MERTLSTVVLVYVALVAGGCSYNVLTPPGRTIPLETARTLAPGRTAIQGEAGIGADIWDASFATGTLRVRHGFREHLEGSVEANFAHIYNHSGEGDTHPNFYSLRTGIKWEGAPFVAITAGLGGGWFAGGGYLAPDVGVIFSYENPYAIPFTSLRWQLSQPLNPQFVSLISGGEEHGERPDTTFGFAWNAGVRIPFKHHPEGRPVSSALMMGTTMGVLSDGDNGPDDGTGNVIYVSGTIGVEYVFGR